MAITIMRDPLAPRGIDYCIVFAWGAMYHFKDSGDYGVAHKDREAESYRFWARQAQEYAILVIE